MKKMKSFFAAAFVFVMATVGANAQMVDQVNLEAYAKQQYGENWEKAACAEMAQQGLDAQGNMVFTKEISAPGMSKNDLYVEMANWFICNYDNSLQFADKEQGVLIARPFVQDIARSAGGFNAYNVSICPTVRAQVTDGKVNVTYTLHDYNVMVEEGGGTTCKALKVGMAAAAVTATAVSIAQDAHHPHTTVVHHYGGPRHHSSTYVFREYRPHHTFEAAVLASCVASAAFQTPDVNSKTWTLNSCFPFVAKDKHKKASSKAFVMANVYSQVVMNNIETALTQCKVAYRVF